MACRGLVMPGANCLIVCPPPELSSTKECDKEKHLKYVKASVEKKFQNIKRKYFKEYFLFQCVHYS